MSDVDDCTSQVFWDNIYRCKTVLDLIWPQCSIALPLATLLGKLKQLYNGAALFLLIQDKFGSTSEEAGRTRVGWAATKAPWSFPYPETKGRWAERWWLWEDQWTGSRKWWCGLQSISQTFWSHNGKKGECLKNRNWGMIFMNEIISDQTWWLDLEK